MKQIKAKLNRIIGLDLHPEVFSAAALEGGLCASQSGVLWVHDRQSTAQLESWARKHLRAGDTVVLEASGNSFEACSRLQSLGLEVHVLESTQASKIRHNFCNDDRHSAIKLARVYLSGLSKQVWQPGTLTREHREVFFAHRNAVKDATRCRNRIRSFLNEYCARLPAGTRLTEPGGLDKALALRQWSPLQTELIRNKFAQLWEAEKMRKQLEKIMVRELLAHPRWARLWRIIGVRHRVAFALMAMIGDIQRFANPKKLVGYIGLAPRRQQSGSNSLGYERGIGRAGRNDLRALLLQSAHNALTQRSSPLHKWGWKLVIRKHRNVAAVAVARKISVAIWHLLNGHASHIQEITPHIHAKLHKIATLIGKHELKNMGFLSRDQFALDFFQKIQL